MVTRSEQHWDQLFGRTQQYLHNRIFGNGCGRELIEAWRSFYAEISPLARLLIRRAGLHDVPAEQCELDVWTDLLTSLPKLRRPTSRDAFGYWLAGRVREHVGSRQRHRDTTERSSNGAGESPDNNWRMPTACAGTNRERRQAAPLGQATAEQASINYQLFQLLVVEDRPIDEVADLLGLATEEAANRHRAMMQSIFNILVKLDVGANFLENPAPVSRTRKRGSVA